MGIVLAPCAHHEFRCAPCVAIALPPFTECVEDLSTCCGVGLSIHHVVDALEVTTRLGDHACERTDATLETERKLCLLPPPSLHAVYLGRGHSEHPCSAYHVQIWSRLIVTLTPRIQHRLLAGQERQTSRLDVLEIRSVHVVLGSCSQHRTHTVGARLHRLEQKLDQRPVCSAHQRHHTAVVFNDRSQEVLQLHQSS